MLRKCRRIAAVTLASAMIFGSMTVMAEGESIQAAEQETVVTDNEAAVVTEGEAAVLSKEEAAVTVEETTEEDAAEESKEEPIFETEAASWNGKDEIVFDVDTKGGMIAEFSFNVYTTSSKEPIGGAYAWMDHTYNIDENGMGKGNVIFTEKLSAFCEKQGIDAAEVEKVELILVVSYEDGSEPAVKTVTLPVVVYEPGADLKSGTWTGNDDIVIVVRGKGGKTSIAEMYYYKDEISLGGVKVDADIQVDENGNGTITIKNDALKNATTFNGETGEYIKLDWTDIDQLEIDVMFEYQGQYAWKNIYVPVEYKETTVSETTTITDNSSKSGVSMQLPAEAPEGLTLKVTESNGAEEKEAVSKLVQVDGDKIKTFDLSLFMSDKEWSYDGQFKSTVTLPVPEGWNIGALGLYYFDEAANKATAVPFTVDKANHTLTFETTHFSRFVMVQKEVKAGGSENTGKPEGQDKPTDTNKPAENKPAAQNTNVPKTGDDTNVVFYMALLLVAGAAIAGYARKRRV